MLRAVKIFTVVLAISSLFSIALNAQDLKNAIALTESEQFVDAHKAFADLMVKEPSNGEVYYYFGESYLKQYFVDSLAVSLADATKSALECFNKGTEKVPGEPLNFIGAGRVDILLGKFADAETNFQKAKDLMPPVGSPKYNKSLIPVSKQALAFAKIAEAYLKNPSKKKEELLTIVENAIERDPKVPEVFLIKGDIYLSYNDGSSAIVAYNTANDLDPKSCKAMVKIGQLWVRGKAYPDALNYYKDAITIDSTFAPAYRERAELYGLAQQWENGIKDYNKFLELSGNNFYAKVRYAAFLYMAKKYEDAVKVIEELKLTDKDGINTNYNYINRLEAYSYFNLNNYQEALNAIKVFFQFSKPEKIMMDDYSYYGDILSKLNDHEGAIEKYLKAVEMDPANTDVLSKIAKEYNTLKKFAEAAKHFEKKIALNAGTLTDYYDLGKIYLNMKEYDKADTCFGTVLSKKPDYINAVMYRAQGKSVVDSTSELGLAKPYYERLVELSLADSAKFGKYLSTAYDYLRFYYYKQYLLNKKCDDAKECIVFCDKILAIDPKNEAATESKKAMKTKCP